MRILVVEDEKDMNRIIVRRLEVEGYCVDTCYDGDSAYDYLCMAEYDGVLLDVMLPKTDGFTVLKKVRSRGITTPILLLTAKSDVTEITRKKAEVHENIYSCGDLTVDCNKRTVKRGEKDIELSPKEYSVLLYLIRNQNIVVTREQIEANIWDFERYGSSNLVDVYIRYLRKKIDDGFEKKMIQTIRGVGYLLKETE